MLRPKSLLDRVQIEKVANEGVVQPGPAVPNAVPVPREEAPGNQSRIKFTQPTIGPTAGPTAKREDPGSQVDPAVKPELSGPASSVKTGSQFPGPSASPAQKQDISGGQALPTPREDVPGRPSALKVTSPANGPVSSVKTGSQATGPSASPIQKQDAPGGQASPLPKEDAPGRPSAFRVTSPFSGPAAGLAIKREEIGAVASPTTAVPAVPIQTFVKMREDLPGVLALPKTATVVPDGPSKPLQPGRDHIVSPETFAGRTATPKIAESIRAIPASIRNRETVTAVGQVNPKTQVTISVPPAFPYDPQEAFAAVDDMLNLPPQTQGVKGRQILAPANTDDLESTESYVARKYQEREGSFSDLDRWQL